MSLSELVIIYVLYVIIRIIYGTLSHNNEDEMIDTATSRALRTRDLQFE